MDQVLNNLSDRDKYIVARWAYSVGSPIMEDYEYSQLHRMLCNTMPDDEYVQRSWSSDPCPTELLKAIGRNDLIAKVVLLDKTESIPSLNTDWEVKSELEGISGFGTLSMKHDGWNIQANYYNGALVTITTRGRATDAVDVSGLTDLFPKHIPVKDKVKIVSELTINKMNFLTCARLFNNVSSRSAVSTVLARPEYYHLLSVTSFDIHGYDLNGKCKFEVLREWGFNVPAYFEVHDYADLLAALEQLSEMNNTYIEPTDGVVYDGCKRRAIRLLAWEEPIYRSYITGYIEQYGPYRISPSVLIYPILRQGTTQRQVSMTNWQRIVNYNLQPGAPIAFRVASGATVDFDEETTRLLHKEYENRWSEFAKEVERNEEVVKCQHQMYLMQSQQYSSALQ